MDNKLTRTHILYEPQVLQVWMFCTFCFDLECCPDQSEQSGIEGDGAVAVERHVHANQALWTGSQRKFGNVL